MSSFAQGRFALAISDRSGMAFPYNEMVREWNGALVHNSEYEPKQPQLQPKPTNADPQALQRARPARTEFPTADFLPNNPFNTINLPTVGATYKVSQPNSGILVGDFVRLRGLTQPLTGSGIIIPIERVEMSTTLNTNITATDTSMVVNDEVFFYTNGGFVIIEKINSETGMYQNEVIQYAAYNSGKKILSGLVRGTSSPFRGETPANTIASNHDSGAKVFGARKVHSLDTTTSPSAGQPPTVTNQNGYFLKDNDEGADWFADLSGGGLQCTSGPINDRA